MTTLAVPYYGNFYHSSTGFERVYFLVTYDTETDRPSEVRLKVWDEQQTPDLGAWLKDNGVYGVICRDSNTLPFMDKVANRGIAVLGQGSRCAQTVMKNLFM